MLIVMDESTHGESLFQPLQTNNKQIKIAVIFITGYNAIFIVTKNYELIFVSVLESAEFNVITIFLFYYGRMLSAYNQTKFLNFG